MDGYRKRELKTWAGIIVIALGWAVLSFLLNGCVTAVDHGEPDQPTEDLFGPWTVALQEASGATSYSVIDFSPTGCLHDELVRLDAAGNVEARTVYKGTWEPTEHTLDLREPGEPEVVDQYELRGDELIVDGVTYHRGRLVAPTMVGKWRAEESGGVFELQPGGVFQEDVGGDADFFKPGTGLGTSIHGFWDVNVGRLEVHIGSFTSQAIIAVRAYQLELMPGGVYDLVPDDAIGGSP